MQTQMVAVDKIDPDPEQPRKHFDPAELMALAENLKAVGQQVALILFMALGRLVIIDGERRWRAAQLGNITELSAVVLAQRPSAAQLAILRASLDVHRASLNPMERSDLLAKIKNETGWGVGELAERLSMKQSPVSKFLSYQKLIPEAQELLRAGKLDMEKAFILSQKDAAEQLQLMNDAGTLSRDQLRARSKHNGHQPKAKRAVFTVRRGVSITLQGAEFTLAEAIDYIAEMLKQLRKASDLDIDTVQRVLRDKAKA